jgi:hypothetical protein
VSPRDFSSIVITIFKNLLMMMIIILIVIFNFYARPIEPKRHVCAGECPPKGRSSSTTCALGVSTQKQSPIATCALRVSNPKAEPERHLCAGSVKPKCRSPSATWTQGLYSAPKQEPSTTCPYVVFL